jgi:hypothetical protein
MPNALTPKSKVFIFTFFRSEQWLPSSVTEEKEGKGGPYKTFPGVGWTGVRKTLPIGVPSQRVEIHLMPTTLFR